MIGEECRFQKSAEVNFIPDSGFETGGSHRRPRWIIRRTVPGLFGLNGLILHPGTPFVFILFLFAHLVVRAPQAHEDQEPAYEINRRDGFWEFKGEEPADPHDAQRAQQEIPQTTGIRFCFLQSSSFFFSLDPDMRMLVHIQFGYNSSIISMIYTITFWLTCRRFWRDKMALNHFFCQMATATLRQRRSGGVGVRQLLWKMLSAKTNLSSKWK